MAWTFAAVMAYKVNNGNRDFELFQQSYSSLFLSISFFVSFYLSISPILFCFHYFTHVESVAFSTVYTLHSVKRKTMHWNGISKWQIEKQTCILRVLLYNLHGISWLVSSKLSPEHTQHFVNSKFQKKNEVNKKYKQFWSKNTYFWEVMTNKINNLTDTVRNNKK